MGEDDYFFSVAGHIFVNAVPKLWGKMEQIAPPFHAVARRHDVERQTLYERLVEGWSKAAVICEGNQVIGEGTANAFAWLLTRACRGVQL